MLLFIKRFFLIISIFCLSIFLKEKLIIDKNDYLLEIYIPRIKLKKFVYNMDSSLNNVDYNIQILEASKLDNNLFFLASHSGGGGASYFDRLVYLEKGDIIWLNNFSFKYGFVVEEIFYIDKVGYFDITYYEKSNVLYLITCSLIYFDKQLVIKARLIK